MPPEPASTASAPEAAPGRGGAPDAGGGGRRLPPARDRRQLGGACSSRSCWSPMIVGQGLSSEFLTADSFTTGSLDFSEVALMALAADARDRGGGDRPVGRVGARALERAHGLAVEQRPAARAHHAALHRRRGAVRGVQRRARRLPRPAVAGRDDRHARAVPRARLRGHRRRVGDRLPRHLDGPRVRQLRRHARAEHDGAVRHPRRRVRRAAARHAVRAVDLRHRGERGGGALRRAAGATASS